MWGRLATCGPIANRSIQATATYFSSGADAPSAPNPLVRLSESIKTKADNGVRPTPGITSAANYNKCAGVALILHLPPPRSLAFTSSSDPKNPAKEF
jgi:hypothetical protein